MLGVVPFATVLLVRNERDRYLREVLDHHARFGPLVVLDDDSTDGTYEVCRDHPAMLRCERRGALSGAWGAEAPARDHLWRLASDLAEWVLICDADQLLSRDPRPLCQTTSVNAWGFPLYDLWDDRGLYREDQYWRGHLHPRPWLFAPRRVPDGWQPLWPERGIHCGHMPSNFPLVTGLAPHDFYWLHLGYLDPADRVEKLARYRGQYAQMTDFEQAHAESIADPMPNLKILPFAKPIRILAGGPVRKSAAILRAHLDSLVSQTLPPRVTVDYAFVDDYPSDEPGRAALQAFVAERGGKIFQSPAPNPSDFSDQHPVTHQWTSTAMNRVGMHKTLLMQECVQGGYDYLWLADTDLIMDRTTLASLLGCGKGIVSAVYWTRWNTDPHIHAGPQVWLKPPYQLGLPHYPESEFRHQLGVERKLLRVGGLGACTLIQRSVIEKGVGFAKPPNFPSGGLWDGEDRHFCEWARRLHVDLYADAWPDIFHCYHVNDLVRLPEMVVRLREAHPTFANHGSLVSLKLANIEDGGGEQQVRCRIGDGTLLPEVETAVLGMQRGETKIQRIHFPATMAPVQHIVLAGQARLVNIELVDCKPFGLPPALEDEFLRSPQGPVQDMTHLTEAQHALIAQGQA